MRARGIGDLKRANVFVAGNDLQTIVLLLLRIIITIVDDSIIITCPAALNSKNKTSAITHLPVGVLDGRDVRFFKRSLYKSQNERAFTNSSRSENHDPIIVALFGHSEARSSSLIRQHSADKD